MTVSRVASHIISRRPAIGAEPARGLPTDLRRFKRIAFAHVVSAALHCADNLVRKLRAPDAPERACEISCLRRVAAVEKEAQEVRRVGEARQHHLRLDRITQRRKSRPRPRATPQAKKGAGRPLVTRFSAAGIAGTFRSYRDVPNGSSILLFVPFGLFTTTWSGMTVLSPCSQSDCSGERYHSSPKRSLQ